LGEVGTPTPAVSSGRPAVKSGFVEQNPAPGVGMRAMFLIYAAIIWGGLAAWLIVGLTHG
jgi:hypothetical protein